MIVALEGIDGSGKTTVWKYLKETLDSNLVSFSREPSDTGYREILMQAINSGDEVLAALLFAADHRHHIENVIKPALRLGKTIVTDRYLYSHIAYQAAMLEPCMTNATGWLWNIYTEDWILRPDLTIFLRVDPKVAVKRIAAGRTGKPDAYENVETLQKIHDNYMNALSDFARRGRRERVEIMDVTDLTVDEECECVLKLLHDHTGAP